MQIDGQPLEKKRKAPHRLMELLAAIVAYGGIDVPVARLIDVFWPEADGDQAQENFKKSIARLRKLLVVDGAILWQDGKLSLNREQCWVDAYTFEANSKEADLREVTGMTARDGNEEKEVDALYRGPFLGRSEIPLWAVSYQERLRTQFTKLFMRREKAMAGSQREQLMVELARAIDVDPVAEPLYQQLIPLLVAANRHAEAAAYYDRCRTELARWAGRSPSAGLQELTQTIRLR
ncbi:MAG: BTAD domain-containing putative transcriptional regulator [Nitrospirota bacterium]